MRSAAYLLEANMKKVAIIVAGLVLFGTGTATAGSLITSSKIKDSTIKMRDLAPGVREKVNRPGPQGAQGAQGVAGAVGPRGPAGFINPNLISDVTVTKVAEPGETVEIEAECPANYSVLSGGYQARTVRIAHTGTNLALTGWFVEAVNDGSVAAQVYVFAYCVPG